MIAQAVLYLPAAEDVQGAQLCVGGRPVAFHTIMGAVRAGMRRIGVPAVFHGTEIERAIAVSPSARRAVVWLSAAAHAWQEPALLLPATLVASPAAITGAAAAGLGTAVITPEDGDAPLATGDPTLLASLWPAIAAGDPVGDDLGRALGARGVLPAAWARRVRLTSAGSAREVESLLREALASPLDSWLDTHLHRWLSRPLSACAVAWRLTPNQISLASLGVGLAAAWCLWEATPGRAALGLLLYVAAVVLDHADGEVARLTLTESEFGHWLDLGVDTAVLGLVVLALGSTAATAGPEWTELLGPTATAGVVASAAAAKCWPRAGASPGQPGRLGRVLEQLGNRDAFFAMLVAFVGTLALAPAWLPALMLVVAAGTHAYWVGRVLVALPGRWPGPGRVGGPPRA